MNVRGLDFCHDIFESKSAVQEIYLSLLFWMIEDDWSVWISTVHEDLSHYFLLRVFHGEYFWVNMLHDMSCCSFTYFAICWISYFSCILVGRSSDSGCQNLHHAPETASCKCCRMPSYTYFPSSNARHILVPPSPFHRSSHCNTRIASMVSSAGIHVCNGIWQSCIPRANHSASHTVPLQDRLQVTNES